MKKESEIVQSEFVSLISHELRTPLSSIIEGAAMLLEGLLGELNEKQRRCVEIIREDIQRLNRVLMDILELSRIESGNVVLEVSKIRLPDLLYRVGATFYQKINQKKLKYREEVAPDLPEITSDAEKLVSILSNLLSNAIKFTPESGNILVRIRSMEKSILGTQPVVEISVADSGKGISEQELPHIFERFSQLQKGGERSTGSLGLGLAITKAFAEMLHGRIDVESEAGKGSTFTVILPLQIKAKGVMGVPAALRPAPAKKRRILVVDDEANIREMVAMRLELSGYEVEAVPSGEEALDAISKNMPDLILLDWLMPGIGGEGALKKIRADVTLRKIPVLVVSAKSDYLDSDDIRHRLADGFIAKPFVADELLAAIRQMLPD